MTGIIFKEWLLWFISNHRDRKTLLLIDGFSAYKCGIDLLEAEYPDFLWNVRIEFLPANATSLCQPLDQGIIKAWKAQFRKK